MFIIKIKNFLNECFNKTIPTNECDVLKTEARWNGIYKIILLLVIAIIVNSIFLPPR